MNFPAACCRFSHLISATHHAAFMCTGVSGVLVSFVRLKDTFAAPE